MTNGIRSGRRPLLKGAAGLTVLGAGALGLRTFVPQADSGNDGSLQLSTRGENGMPTLEVQIDPKTLKQVSAGRWQSAQLPASEFAMVGFTWTGAGAAPTIKVRTRSAGSWSSWFTMPGDHAASPDEVRVDARAVGRTGTEPLWAGSSNAVQVELAGAVPPGLTLVLLNPTALASDAAMAEEPPLGQKLSARLSPGETALARVAPSVLTRAQWGANESLRDGAPRYVKQLQQVHVHHTVNANNYSAGDVPALIRGMYVYHTQSLGWSDLGYNFLVDRFGRVWEGRYGGINRLVRGAHTLGFNHNSVGVSVVGNFETGEPNTDILNAVAQVAAWKLGTINANPQGQVTVTSEGSDKFGSGRTVTLPVVDGHRDTNDTACPGSRLYARLPEIRVTAKELMAEAEDAPVGVLRAPILSGTPGMGNTVSVSTGLYDVPGAKVTFAWLRNNQPISGATKPVYTITGADLGARLTVRVQASVAGRKPATTVVNAGTIMVTPIVRIVPSGRRGRARITVKVSAPAGVSAVPQGSIRVTCGSREKTRALVAGQRIVRFFKMRPVTRKVTVTYSGGGGFRPASATSSVTVLDLLPTDQQWRAPIG